MIVLWCAAGQGPSTIVNGKLDPEAPVQATESTTSVTTESTTATFTDIADSRFREEIEWLGSSGITSGCGGTQFCPKGGVARDQMASFLARALNLPKVERDYFTDDEGNKHEDNINRVAAAGITVGCGRELYCPAGLVLRDQMATFLARALTLPHAGTDYFADDNGNKHEDRINRLRASRITFGCGEGRFCPKGVVLREQMAAFLYRAFALEATPSPSPPPSSPSPTASVSASPSPSPSPPDDTTAPTVTGQSPSPDATNVATSTTVTATFSEQIDPASLTGAMTLTSSGGAVSGSVSYSAGAHTATFTPSSSLAASTTYTAALDGGSGGISDLAGNPLAADVSWSFTTATPPPTVTRIMPLGDSITDGFNVPGGYRINLHTHLTNAGVNFDFVGSKSNGPTELPDKNHEGWSGYRIGQIHDGVLAWLSANSPDAVLLLAGTNDVLQDADLANAPARLSALIDRIRTARPTATIYVGSIPPLENSTDNAQVIDYNADLQDVVAAKASSQVRFVDIYSGLNPGADLADGVHPNRAGYDKIAAAWWNAIDDDLTTSAQQTSTAGGAEAP